MNDGAEVRVKIPHDASARVVERVKAQMYAELNEALAVSHAGYELGYNKIEIVRGGSVGVKAILPPGASSTVTYNFTRASQNGMLKCGYRISEDMVTIVQADPTTSYEEPE